MAEAQRTRGWWLLSSLCDVVRNTIYAFTKFTHTIEIFKKHEQKGYHKEAMVKMESFIHEGDEWPAGQYFCPDQCSEGACCDEQKLQLRPYSL